MLDNKLFAQHELTGEIMPNGDIQLSSGYVLRTFEPLCAEEDKCALSDDLWDDRMGRAWASWDAEDLLAPLARKKIEDVRFFTNENGEKCTESGLSGINCYDLIGHRYHHKEYPWISAESNSVGDLVWSHGYVTRPDSSPCTACVITFADFIGQKVTSKYFGEVIEDTLMVKTNAAGDFCIEGS